ncbi:DUF6766 family protein [Flavobacterium sp. LB3P122]|uniref:DUF6766 family protein n=1 Tax=Flavobacterium algoriphilum TaxID=3398738 RepID=UPI003A8775BD
MNTIKALWAFCSICLPVILDVTFENLESEFLSVFAIIFLSIYLREKGSPKSKPVDASHTETGK